MLDLSTVKDIIMEAKKKYKEDKYIIALEEQINLMQYEIERLNTKISLLEKNKFVLNKGHLELFELFRNNNYKYDEKGIKEYAKKNIDLEIALSELIANGYFEYPVVFDLWEDSYYQIPENKKIEFLQALKNK